jgi:endonuclease YncB( thermonuclease family)
MDGGTFYLGSQSIRIADIDTPETHPSRCAYEAALGARATDRLLQLLNSGPFALHRLADRDTDQYGRELRTVIRDGRSLGNILVSEGLAWRWTGDRRPWCT